VHVYRHTDAQTPLPNLPKGNPRRQQTKCTHQELNPAQVGSYPKATALPRLAFRGAWISHKYNPEYPREVQPALHTACLLWKMEDEKQVVENVACFSHGLPSGQLSVCCGWGWRLRVFPNQGICSPPRSIVMLRCDLSLPHYPQVKCGRTNTSRPLLSPVVDDCLNLCCGLPP
jgi:hypothetical protein